MKEQLCSNQIGFNSSTLFDGGLRLSLFLLFLGFLLLLFLCFLHFCLALLGLHEAETRAARTLEQELHCCKSPYPNLSCSQHPFESIKVSFNKPALFSFFYLLSYLINVGMHIFFFF
ncbi:hypothetical protein F2P56_005213 [Juglans regia]|uniref:Uncharacterized protein n=1 Tax=Juglans regia TaxID=51240 RepID=A0A833Y965_JUGRE|nr:hypothetical protein F2P56_005213 [Juglans regia]